jgi:hypothetical protein
MLAKLPAARTALLTAADLIEQRGLAKREREDARGALCLHGAITFAISGYAEAPSCDDDHEACRLIYGYLTSQGVTGIGPSGSAPWNNAPERTQQEVVESLRNAAMFGL